MIFSGLRWGRKGAAAAEAMRQTPVHEAHNPDLLALMPVGARAIVEVGCGSGALAREFKVLNPGCDYLGIDISEDYAALARRHCDTVMAMNIDQAAEPFFDRQRNRDCWVFGDCLEHLKDPWRVLELIRWVIPESGCVAACIPNAQHWSLQARLALGEWRYEDAGLLDRTHLRFFTRKTIVELFEAAGFRVDQMRARVFHEPDRERALDAIAEVATRFGGDGAAAMADATPLQYVVRALPA